MQGRNSVSCAQQIIELDETPQDACIVELAQGRDVGNAVKRFSALGTQFVSLAHGDLGQSAAVINWRGSGKSTPRTTSDRDLSEWLLVELAERYAQMIAAPHHDAVSLAIALRQPTLLNPGTDSHAIWFLETKDPMVLKVGSPAVINLETDFFKLARTVSPQLFPRVWSSGNFAGRAWYLMEAGKPDSGEGLVFSKGDRLELDPDWVETLVSALMPLAQLYRGTLIERSCKVARYHYSQRISGLLKREDFRRTAAETAGVGEVETLLQKPLHVNGMVLPSTATLVDRSSRSGVRSAPSYSTMIHGDLHLKNMVSALDARGFILLDPRLQWDREQVDRFAHGDPVYDLGTLLHSVGGMAAILQAIETNSADQLVAVQGKGGEIRIDFAPLLMDLIKTTLLQFPKICIQLLPAETMGSSFPFRLYTGAANATFGWLKYQDAVKSEHAWWAIYALASVYLDAASGRGLASA